MRGVAAEVSPEITKLCHNIVVEKVKEMVIVEISPEYCLEMVISKVCLGKTHPLLILSHDMLVDSMSHVSVLFD